VIDWKLDGFLPTQRQPAPKVETADDRDVVIDRGVAAAIDLIVCYVLIEFPLIYVASVVFSGPYEALGGAVVPSHCSLSCRSTRRTRLLSSGATAGRRGRSTAAYW